MKCLLRVLVFLGTLAVLLFGKTATRADVTIMPLGDSVTWGGAPAFSVVPGGYRSRLYSDLHNAGYSFDFVGTSTSNPSSLLTQVGQTHHEGHFGYRIDQIANNLDGNDGSNNNNGGFWFHKPAPPNIILLFIGGNDILQNFQTSTMAQRLDKLIGQIVTDSPTSLLFVSNVYLPPLLTPAQNQLLQAYNSQIQDVIVPKYASLGDQVIFVDQASNFVDASGNRVHFSPDNIHPDQVGYDLMADTWAAALQQAAPVPEPTTLLLLGIGTLGLIGWKWRRHLSRACSG